MLACNSEFRSAMTRGKRAPSGCACYQAADTELSPIDLFGCDVYHVPAILALLPMFGLTYRGV